MSIHVDRARPVFLVVWALLSGAAQAQTRKLDPPSRPGPSASVGQFALGADGEVAVYALGSFFPPPKADLFVVSKTGVRQLAGPLDSLASFRISPDERFLVYAAIADGSELPGLFRASLDAGSAPLRLSAPAQKVESDF